MKTMNILATGSSCRTVPLEFTETLSQIGRSEFSARHERTISVYWSSETSSNLPEYGLLTSDYQWAQYTPDKLILFREKEIFGVKE